MLNVIFFHVPARFQKHLFCQKPLVIVSGVQSHKRHDVCEQTKKTPPQCEDWIRMKMKKEKRKEKREQRTSWLLSL